MSESRFDRVQQLFLQVISLPADERTDWLAQECGGDLELADEVALLVAEALRGDDPLERGFPGLLGDQPTATESLSPNPRLRQLLSSLNASEPNGIPLEAVGEYRILREVGRGGMGVVYEAEHATLNRRVALKLLSDTVTAASNRERFHREARAAASLHHSNIVPVFDFGEDDGIPFYAMQYIKGCGIDAVVRWARDNKSATNPSDIFRKPCQEATADETGKALIDPTHSDGSSSSVIRHAPRWQYIAHLGLQAAEAIHHAHLHGVIHRDIKPSNLLIDDNDHVWITDFGLAKTVGDCDLTATGDLVGTLRYLAPESIRGKSDKLADVYGLGLVLYELVTLQRPFDDSDGFGLIERISERGPTPIEQLQAGVPRDLRTIVKKAIARDPTMRYRHAGALADDLRSFVEDKPIRARRSSWAAHVWSWARRNRIAATLLTILALVILIGFVASTLFSIHLNHVVDERSQRLFHAKLNEAASIRSGGGLGHRFGAIRAIEEAVELLPTVNHNEAVTLRLRNELIGAVGLTDLKLEREWPGEEFMQYGVAYHDGIAMIGGENLKRTRVVLKNSSTLQTVVRSQSQKSCGGFIFSPNGRWVAWRQGRPQKMAIHDLSVDRSELNDDTLVLQRNCGDSVGSRYCFDDSDTVAFYDPNLGCVIVHDLRLGSDIWQLPFPTLIPERLALSRDARRLAVYATDKNRREHSLRVWNVGSHAAVMNLESIYAKQMAFNHDGSELAVPYDFSVGVWRIDNGRQRLRLADLQTTQSVAYTRHGDILISTGWGPFTTFWDAAHGEQLLRVPGVFGSRGSHVENGGRLAIHQGDRMCLFRFASGREKKTVLSPQRQLHVNAPKVLALHPNGRLVAMTTNSSVRLGDAVQGNELGEMLLGTNYGGSCFSRSGDTLFTFTENVTSWPISHPEPGRLAIGPPKTLVSNAFSDGWIDEGCDHLVYKSNKTLFAVEFRSNKEARPIFDYSAYVNSYATFLPKHLVACTHHAGTVLVDAAEKKELREFPRLFNSRFSPDGEYLFLSGANRLVAYSIPDDRVLYEIDGCGSAGGSVAVQDDTILTMSAQPPGLLLSHRSQGNSLAFFPSDRSAMPRNVAGLFNKNSNHVVSFGEFNALIAWDIAAVREKLQEFGLDWESPTTLSAKDMLTADDQTKTWLRDQRLQVDIDWGGRRREFIHRGLAALIHRNRNIPASVLEGVNERLARSPGDVDLLVERAKLYLTYLDDELAARKDLQQALKHDPSDMEAARLLLNTTSSSLLHEGQQILNRFKTRNASDNSNQRVSKTSESPQDGQQPARN